MDSSPATATEDSVKVNEGSSRNEQSLLKPVLVYNSILKK